MEGGLEDRAIRIINMRQQFSTSWQSSRQPRKQRKFRYNAPLHIKAKFLSAHLSGPLQEKHKFRTAVVRKGDEVVVMRGEFKKKNAKVSRVNVRKGKIYIEGLTVTKKDGTKVEVAIHPSNVQIISLVEDKFRFNKNVKKDEIKPVADNNSKVQTKKEKSTKAKEAKK